MDSWFCDLCKREVRSPRLIYGVYLCFLCIAETADNPRLAHHWQCKCYELEQKIARLKRVNARLQKMVDMLL